MQNTGTNDVFIKPFSLLLSLINQSGSAEYSSLRRHHYGNHKLLREAVPVIQQVVLPLKSFTPSALTRGRANTTLWLFHIFDGTYTDVHWAKVQPDFKSAKT